MTRSAPVAQLAEGAMTLCCEAERDRYVVRWREGGGNRSRRFVTLTEAEAFDDSGRIPAADPAAMSDRGRGRNRTAPTGRVDRAWRGPGRACMPRCGWLVLRRSMQRDLRYVKAELPAFACANALTSLSVLAAFGAST